jgi:hypothetical protein
LQNSIVSTTINTMSKWFARLVGLGAVVVCAAGCVITVAYADTLQSPNYKFDESSIGSGGLVQSSSTNYQTRDALGDTAIGNSTSANYQIESGSKTTSEPTLSFAVNNASANFGSFTASGASTATATFSVSDYTSYGYVVQLFGNAPSNGAHTLSAMGTTTASHAGTEQFGLNLVANTSPTSLGANPNHGQFGFGSATTNYGTSNVYRFVTGETIASAPKSSGLTTYTMSYIVNVASLTPGGQYTSDQVIICTGTY